MSSPEKRSHYLPVVAFSLRLLLEICAQEFYEANDPGKDYKDGALKPFLRLAKKELEKASYREKVTELSLNTDWIKGDLNFEAILSKWAHGTLTADNGTVVRISVLAGDIIRLMWSD